MRAPVRRVAVVLVLAAVMAVATAVGGWGFVPLVAAVAVLLARLFARAGGRLGRLPLLTAAGAGAAGVLAWGELLLVAAAGPRFAAVAALVGEVVGAPWPAVLLATLLLPAALAWGAAALTEALVPARRPRAPDPITLRAPGPPGRPAESSAESTAAATP